MMGREGEEGLGSFLSQGFLLMIYVWCREHK